jgi:transposase InsO family protein
VADPTQTLQRELLDQVDVWPDIAAVQAAVDAFRTEYNTNRPHQALDMGFPADRFVAGPPMRSCRCGCPPR